MKGLLIRFLPLFVHREHIEPDILLEDNDTISGHCRACSTGDDSTFCRRVP
jgi:hypothetical protein